MGADRGLRLDLVRVDQPDLHHGGQDESTGFKVVHGILAAIWIAFGLAAGWIGLRRLRAGP